MMVGKQKLRGDMPLWLFPVLVGIAFLASAADTEKEPLPKLDQDSAKGLQVRCSLVKTNCTVGEPVNVWCLESSGVQAGQGCVARDGQRNRL
jgi:hypothetical protein